MNYDSTMPPHRPPLILLAPPLILLVVLAWSCCCAGRTASPAPEVDTGGPQCYFDNGRALTSRRKG